MKQTYQTRFRRCLSFFMTTVMIFTSITFTKTQHAKAAGTINITSAAELQKIGNDSAYPLDGDYILTNDIDLTGINWTPIGGGYGDKGVTSGTHVFNGTFDGQGYTIKGLSIQTTTANASCAQMGLFGTIGSNRSNDYAAVKNLVFRDVNIQVTTDIATSVGALAGDIAGYADIDNIAVQNGTISATSGAADIIGIAGIIGEARTNLNIFSGGNNYISISNLYNAATIHCNGSIFGNWCSGVVGRIQYSPVNKMEYCLNVGTTSITNSDYTSEALCGGNALETIRDCYYLEGTGGNASGTAISEDAVKNGTLLNGFSETYWIAESGKAIVPAIIAGTTNFLFATLIPSFANGEDASSVTQNFTLPASIKSDNTEKSVTWESNKPDIIEIQGSTAIVHEVLSNVTCILTATIDSSIKKEYRITVVSNTYAEFDSNVVKIGTPLKIVLKNLPDGNTLHYSWKVGDKSINNNSDSYTPTEDDLEKFITCTITIPDTDFSWTVSMYMSNLPVIYINTENEQEVTDKEYYINADCKIQGNEEFQNSKILYDGVTEIRGRGNFTWVRPKKPYKLKLNKKTSLFGMDESKHWVLLANYADTSLMKNELFGKLWEDLDWEYSANAEPVILIMNGEYEGVYHLGENVRIEKGRVNIHNWEEDAEDIAQEVYEANRTTLTKEDQNIMEEQLTRNLSWATTRTFTYKNILYNIDEYDLDIPTDTTGGYLLELDTYDAYHTQCASDFLTDLNQQMTFKTPEFVEGTNDEMYNYAKDFIQAYENAAISDDHAAQYNGKTMTYSELFDMNTIVKYWLSTEIITNSDGMRFSNFMYKDIGQDKFKMGPMWDYDWTWSTGTGAQEWQTDTFTHNNNDQWHKHLIKDPYFVVQAYEMYHAYKAALSDMVKDGGDIDTIYEKMKTAGDADMAKWHGGENYTSTVQNVKNFAITRINWLDTQFASLSALMNSLRCLSNTSAIKLSTPDTTSIKGETKIEVTTTDTNISQLIVEVNGKMAGTFDADDTKTTIMISDDMLTTKENGFNTVQVFAKDSEDNYIQTNGEAIWNYTTFKKEALHTPMALEGTVIISGTSTVGNTLTATVIESNSTGTLSYQWRADNVNIPGATQATFVPRPEDIGKRISVIVTSSVETGSIYHTCSEIIHEKPLATIPSIPETTVSTVPPTAISTSPQPTTPATQETQTTLTKTPKITLNVKSITLQIKQSTTGVKIKTKTLTSDTIAKWSSSKPNIASVNKKGKITAKKVGKTTITAIMKSGATASCTVRVQKKAVATTRLIVAKKKITLNRGKKCKIIYTRYPFTANDKVTLTSSNKKIIKIVKNNTIKAAQKKGIAYITVTAGKKKKRIKVTVK